jgi:glycine amidinotransferase
MRVNAWNEWDRLTHVIVGRADNAVIQAEEPSVIRDFPEDGFPRGTYGPMPSEMVARASKQLDDFARLLEGRGIRVDRPDPLDFSQPVSTPEWTQATMAGCMPPRDLLITLGNELLEATMSARSRWHEYLCYRPLIERYYRADPQMRWEAAPKPRLTDASYVENFWDEFAALSRDEQIERAQRGDLVLTEAEPLFDAADIVRFGRDLFVQLSLVTNRAGVRWLTQHLTDFRVHDVTFANHNPMHIDATWVPLRPGLILHCGARPAGDDLLQYCKINDWQVVEAARPGRTPQTLPPLCYCTPWLSMNVLSLDPKTVCVESTEVAQMDQLDKLGFEVIPVPLWDVAPFGGGINCATTDICREGVKEDYFPRRYGRF